MILLYGRGRWDRVEISLELSASLLDRSNREKRFFERLIYFQLNVISKSKPE